MLGMDPAEHYLRFGAAMERSPGPGFDGAGYLAMYPDVERAGVIPLLHYLRHGRAEGRIPGFLPPPSTGIARARLVALAETRLRGAPKRHLPALGKTSQALFIGNIQTMYAASQEAIDHRLASIVMPTYNRKKQIVRAIESVQEQTHRNWELLIVDDGSTDGTPDAIRPYLRDPRIRLIGQPRRGVSAARNAALALARGDTVFYLDSDNRWTPDFLHSMLTYLHATGNPCGYSALAIEGDDGKISGYRGEPFSWSHCLQSNYVDLNVFCHDIKLYRDLGGFDESLRRMVDWDLILRYARDSKVAYAPFIGCYYTGSETDQSRISLSQPYAYRAIVQTKNRLNTGDPQVVANHLHLNFAIKIAAPSDKRDEWGDYHYAVSLAEALRSLGHSVTIDFRDQWYARHQHRDQVIIVLRGLQRYKPNPEHINILWNISHPDQVSYAEYESHDIVYVASPSYPSLLNQILGKPARTLLQCTDTRRFGFSGPAGDSLDGLLFVGNSRNHFRHTVRWATELEMPVKVHGTRWSQFIDARHIVSEHVPNTELAAHYASATAVLNDHWESMRNFGLISNRVFDVLACGGTLISDSMPSIQQLFGDAVLQVDSRDTLAQALATLESAPRSAADALRISRQVHQAHSFDARAATIWNDVLGQLGLPPRAHQQDPGTPEVAAPSAIPAAPKRKRAGLLLQRRAHGPSSSAYIRLIAPLTTDLAHADIDMVLLDGVEDGRLDNCDYCIVQRVAVEDIDDAVTLVERVRTLGCRLFVDNDDAFGALDKTHPEHEFYRERDAVLRYLMGQADQVWFSTEHLHSLYRDDARNGIVLPNNLDPRLWRDYRKPRWSRSGGPLQLLYMGTATHDADFAAILPALDALAELRPDSFQLTNIAAVRSPPQRSWLKNLPPPRNALSYPHFVRWLVAQGPFDVGLAPLADTGFNASKSDIKILDYCALGLISLVSDVPCYQHQREQQPFALRVANNPQAWLASLCDVMDDSATHRQLAAQAADHVWDQRNATHSAQALLATLGRTP
ncbi:glycosyltransferase [Novilysobacter avium]|nr:glycosyltransferase [Lysobacter avium]